MDKNSLRLVNVSSGYDLQKVIHGISLNIEEGSIVGIIGPNGHGKSTLVKTVSGLVSTWSGWETPMVTSTVISSAVFPSIRWNPKLLWWIASNTARVAAFV